MEKICEYNTIRAPCLQSSPIRRGKTTVFNPQGMHATITAKGYTVSGRGITSESSLQIPNTSTGNAIKRKPEKTSVSRSGKSSFGANDAMTRPVRIMLKVPVHADAVLKTV